MDRCADRRDITEITLEMALNTIQSIQSREVLQSRHQAINTSPDDKVLALSKLKAFADDRLDVTQNIMFVFHREEHIMGKGEKC